MSFPFQVSHLLNHPEEISILVKLVALGKKADGDFMEIMFINLGIAIVMGLSLSFQKHDITPPFFQDTI